jgi:hypothetical protein
MLLNTRAINNSINVSPLSLLESFIFPPFSLSSACRKTDTVIPSPIIPKHRVLNCLHAICFRDGICSRERHPRTRRGELLIIVFTSNKLLRTQRQVLEKFKAILRHKRCPGQVLTERVAPERGDMQPCKRQETHGKKDQCHQNLEKSKPFCPSHPFIQL